MIYRLRVILDNDTKEDILRDVEIDKNSNLTDLHELILLSFNFSADQMASFYTVDEDWNQINEISLMNFDESTDSMDSMLIANVLNNQNTKLLYIYDFMNMWTFYVELIEEAEKINNIIYPRIIFSAGNVPEKAPEKKFTDEHKKEEDLDEDEYLY
ncbi:MAG: plasmid pRiA4b ORF-3 family protein [Flavobacteriaceae bacterium]|nr:plasmid pRiA4b ORF-3 family protein [Flavobacteriaceae bacterium]